MILQMDSFGFQQSNQFSEMTNKMFLWHKYNNAIFYRRLKRGHRQNPYGDTSKPTTKNIFDILLM